VVTIILVRAPVYDPTSGSGVSTAIRLNRAQRWECTGG
jgi:hypothetical protein